MSDQNSNSNSPPFAGCTYPSTQAKMMPPQRADSIGVFGEAMLVVVVSAMVGVPANAEQFL